MPSSKDHTSLEQLGLSPARLLEWGLRDPTRSWHNLQQLQQSFPSHQLTSLVEALGRHLPACSDPDMALNNLERFIANPEAEPELSRLLEPPYRTLEILLHLFSVSQYFSDLLARHPQYVEMLHIPLRHSPERDELVASLQDAVDAAYEDSAVLRAFRSFRERQLLRIGTNDIIRDRPLEEITQDIARVADAAVEVALRTAWRHLCERFGTPMTGSNRPARCVVLAFGKLGGEELNYSSDIDLMVVYDEEGMTSGRTSIGNDEFFGRVTTEMVRLLTKYPPAYRVDLRLRPEGERGPLARSFASTLSYYDTLGRTWERQALIKLRPVAGDLELGQQFLEAIEPFVYRKYLSFAEINEIKALKRRIEQRTSRSGGSLVEVKTGYGGIRDVEFVIQFLQLLNGGDLPELRQRNTLRAIEALERTGCLHERESRVLDSTYRFLRKIEHRLQLMFDLQTHRLPEKAEEMYQLAHRMGYRDADTDGGRPRAWEAVSDSPALARFRADYRQKTEHNRTILNHLLHETFHGGAKDAEPESDLILDPAPEPQVIEAVLGRYRFRDVSLAYRNLMQLAQESVPFLPSRRCRHFLASIAPQLLRALAQTPDPDMALTNLEKVTASLGAKGVLWELFSRIPPTLKLYVDLCAGSQFLSDILINNPGMIDELLETLVSNEPRTRDLLHQDLAQLCRGAEDPEPILHSFRDQELLRIGVYDILGKDTIQTTLAALTDLAETILQQIVEIELKELVRRYGLPVADNTGMPCRFVLLGLGKLGGREMSYNSDLDLVLIYEEDGQTRPATARELAAVSQHWNLAQPLTLSGTGAEASSTTNFHFFSELAQLIIKRASHLGPYGRLYQVDMRLRPTGRSGSLAIPLAEFQRYYAEGDAQLWERQALTRGRVVVGEAAFAETVQKAVTEAAYGTDWQPQFTDEIHAMRQRLEASGSDRDLKRGFGGIVDIEFLIQTLQLKHGATKPAIRATNAWHALDALRREGLLTEPDYRELRDNYDFLRRVESRLRIVQNLTQDQVPAEVEDAARLARRLGYEHGDSHEIADRFLKQMEQCTRRTREIFLRILQNQRHP